MDKEQKIRLQFLDEAQEYLKTLEAGFLGSSSQGISTEQMNSLLRAAHSIKGGAAVMRFSLLSEFSHHLEDGLKVLRTPKGRQLLDPDLEGLLLTAVDSLRTITHHYIHDRPLELDWVSSRIAPVFNQLHDRLGDPSAEDEAQLLSEESGVNVAVLMFETEVEACLEQLETLLKNPDDSDYPAAFQSAAEQLEPLGYMLDLLPFSALCQDVAQQFAQVQPGSEQAHALATATIQTWRRCQALVLINQLSSLPDRLEAIEPSTAVALDLLDRNVTLEPKPTPVAPEEVPRSLASVPKIPVSTPEKQPKSASPPVRVAAQHLDRLTELLGELVTQRSGLHFNLQQLRDLLRSLKQRIHSLEQANRQLRGLYDGSNPQTQSRIQTISSPPINPDRLSVATRQTAFDTLEMDQYGDLHLLLQAVMETIVQVQEISDDLDTALQVTESHNRALGRTTKYLQTNLSQVRMRPFSDLVDRFPRAIRDLSLKYNKPVDLKIRGRSTLLEQSILDVINDPLLHLLRNAFDHGIESMETRQAQGKPATGTIELNAIYQGNSTVITLKDDGAGINLDKVKAKALKMGLSPEDLDQASKADLLALIFEPGFSTAAQVTDLSGRGVGLDVVRNNLNQVQGDLRVTTQPGQGTTFTLLLPFSLSVIRVLLVDAQGLMVAIPANAVDEILLVDTDSVQWQDQTLPVILLKHWFAFHRPFSRHTRADALALQRPIINQAVALIVQHQGKFYALGVDRYWREQEVSLQPVQGRLPLPKGFGSCAILSDGHLAPVLDPVDFLQWIHDQPTPPLVPTHSTHANLQERSRSLVPTTILVVDDSINVRRFLATTLEKAGYRVEQAKDGQEALEQLQTLGSFVQAIVSDVEMPRLDGFGLLAQVKTLPACRHIPLIMLTSRSGDKHRRLATQLGASAYLTKPYQEQDLLHTLERIVHSKAM